MKPFFSFVSRSVDRVFIAAAIFTILSLCLISLDFFFGVGLDFTRSDIIALVIVAPGFVLIYFVTKLLIGFMESLFTNRDS